MENTTTVDAIVSSQLKAIFEKAEQRFRFWQVESLLNRSADLLDRCLGDVVRFQELTARARSAEMESNVAEQSFSIEEQRINNGSISRVLKNLEEQAKELGPEGLKAQHVAAVDHFNKAKGGLKESALHSANGALQQAEIARIANDHDIERIKRDINWQTLDEKLQVLQHENLRSQLVDREAAMVPLGPLDFFGQAEVAKARAARDCQEACEMLHVASQGLSIIYGYADVFDDVLDAGPLENFQVETVEAVIGWNRQAIRWLAAFAQSDQSFTVTVSLKTLLDSKDWEALTAGKNVRFRLPSAEFEDFYVVRLRGMSACFVEDQQPLHPIRVAFKLPAKGMYIQPDGPERLIDQTAVPACHFGRVLDIRLPGGMEIYGQVALMNASPVGIDGDPGLCNASLREVVPKTLGGIQDVLVDLRLTGQPR